MREEEEVSALTHWLVEGTEPVSAQLAEARARICRTCPLNMDEGLYEDVVGLAAAMVQVAFEIKHRRKLTVEGEEKLHICDACGCDLKLKVHAPASVLFVDGTPGYFEKLAPMCWIRDEGPHFEKTKL